MIDTRGVTWTTLFCPHVYFPVTTLTTFRPFTLKIAVIGSIHWNSVHYEFSRSYNCDVRVHGVKISEIPEQVRLPAHLTQKYLLDFTKRAAPNLQFSFLPD